MNKSRRRLANASASGLNALRASFDLKRLDGFQVVDGVLKWKEDLLVEFVVIEVDHDFRNPRNQPSQDLALHWREVEEAIEHQQLHVCQPGITDSLPIKFTIENSQRAQLIRVLFGELMSGLAVRCRLNRSGQSLDRNRSADAGRGQSLLFAALDPGCEWR